MKSHQSMLLVLAVLVVLVSGCASAPSPRQLEMEARYGASESSWKASSRFMKPMAWVPGQYVVTGQKDNGKIVSITRMLIVAKDKKGWVVEINTDNADGTDSDAQYLLLGYDEAMKTGDLTKISYGWMKMKDEAGTVTTMEGEQLLFLNTLSKSTMEKLVVNIKEFVDGGDLVVPAGSFPGSNRVESQVVVFGFKVDTTSWFHPAVPVNGMVKSVDKEGKNLTELLKFGNDGKSEF